jgi:hypothetical protein
MSIQFARFGNHNLSKIDIDSPISALVGFGECVSSHWFLCRFDTLFYSWPEGMILCFANYLDMLTGQTTLPENAPYK